MRGIGDAGRIQEFLHPNRAKNARWRPGLHSVEMTHSVVVGAEGQYRGLSTSAAKDAAFGRDDASVVANDEPVWLSVEMTHVRRHTMKLFGHRSRGHFRVAGPGWLPKIFYP